MSEITIIETEDLESLLRRVVREEIAKTEAPRRGYCGVEEVAAYLGLSKVAVRHKVARKEIPHVRDGRSLRFSYEALDHWMAERAEGAP